MRSELDYKLKEISDLVSKLQRPVRPVRKSDGREKLAKKRTEEERRALMESLNSREGCLPKIDEDRVCSGQETMKYVELLPRTADRSLTFNSEEQLAEVILQATSGDFSDSPDVGPPPVSHLINEEPLKLDFTPSISTSPDLEHESEEPILSVNLEQRRKRRDISTGSSRRDSAFVSELKSLGSVSGVSKPPKRKLMVADDGVTESREARAVAISPADDFKYTRRNITDNPPSTQSEPEAEKAERKKPAKDDSSDSAPAAQPIPAKTPRSRTSKASLTADTPILPAPTLSSRRALGPKQSNFDVANSPKKRAARNADIKDKGIVAPRITEVTPKDTERRSRSRTPSVPVEDIIVHRVEISDSESAVMEVMKEHTDITKMKMLAATRSATPPPQTIRDTSSEREAARPSRRARASVSYAEPNLRDKMRRPGKELVDAIVVTGEKRRDSSFARTSEEPSSIIKIKAEPVEDDSWKNGPIPMGNGAVMPQSEIETSESQETVAATQIITEPLIPIPEPPQRRRRTINPTSDESSTATVNKSLAIPTGRKTPRELQPRAEKIVKPKVTEVEVKEKDVYDFDTTDSSIPGHQPPATSTARISRPSARLLSGGDEGKRLTTARRRQSAIVGSVSTSNLAGDEKPKREAGLGLQRSGSALGLNSASSDAEGGGEGRTSSRRRSMML